MKRAAQGPTNVGVLQTENVTSLKYVNFYNSRVFGTSFVSVFR